MVLSKILDQYVLLYQRWIKLVIRLGNYDALNTLTKTLTFVVADANANADTGGSTIALPERCSGELIKINDFCDYFLKINRCFYASSFMV